jgi:hypothetical protein
LVLNEAEFIKINSMEIIEIRVQYKAKQKLEQELKKILTEMENKQMEQPMKVYKRLNMETDYVILLMNQSNEITVKDSQLGIRLSSVLNDYGMVNYSKWKEM